MNLVLDARHLPDPPVLASIDEADRCESRGYCGPFVNQAFYTSFPDPFWHGMGECVHCGTTRRINAEGPQVPLQITTAA